jgi:hypothetical protein
MTEYHRVSFQSPSSLDSDSSIPVLDYLLHSRSSSMTATVTEAGLPRLVLHNSMTEAPPSRAIMIIIPPPSVRVSFRSISIPISPFRHSPTVSLIHTKRESGFRSGLYDIMIAHSEPTRLHLSSLTVEEFLSPAMAFISRQRSRTAESVMITEER